MRRILFLTLALAGCSDTFDGVDPYRQEGAWRPGGVNEHNLRAMIAAPPEIVRGTGAAGADGEAAADAVARLRTDRLRALPETSSIRVITGGN